MINKKYRLAADTTIAAAEPAAKPSLENSRARLIRKKGDIPAPARGRLSEDLATKGRRKAAANKALHEVESRQARAPRRNDLLPKLELVERSIDALKIAGRDVRPTDPAHVAEIATSIQMFGQCAPLIVAGDEIIDGQARAEAAKSLGLLTVPCVQVEHLDAAERRALRLAMNRLGEKATWDVGELRLELLELKELDTPIELLSFSTPELDLILADPVEPEPEAEEVLEPACGPALARLGDLWILGSHRVHCADATQPESYAELLGEGETVSLALTDPPYNCAVAGHVSSTGKHAEFAMASGEMTGPEFLGFLNSVFVLIAAVLQPGGLLAAFMDWRQVAKVVAAGEASGLELLNLIVWAKTQAAMGSLWRSQHELLPVFKKPGAAHRNNVELGKHGRHRSNLWTYPGANTLGSEAREHLDDHPTPKPVSMLADAILDVTAPGDIVLDPFLGSGSTLMAAERTGRVARGLELDPGYVDVILRRWVKSGGVEPVLAATGQTMSEVMRERLAGLDRASDPAPAETLDAAPPRVRRA